MFPKLKAASLMAFTEVQQILSDTFTSSAEDGVKTMPTEIVVPPMTQSDALVLNSVYPGDNCCTLYDWSWWSGENPLTLCMDEGASSQHWDLKKYGFNDKMASWRCGKSVQYKFCFNEEDCSGLGGRQGGESGAGNIMAAEAGRYDWFTSLWMWSYDPELKGAVTLFEYAGCLGCSAYFLAWETIDKKHEYDEQAMYHNFMWDNHVSSLMIPKGYSITLYDGKNFDGYSVDYSATKWFSNKDQDMHCIDLDEDF